MPYTVASLSRTSGWTLWAMFALAACYSPAGSCAQHPLTTRPTPTGTIVGYVDTPTLPWTDHRYPVHDPDRPIPPIVIPREPGSPPPSAPPPSDAIVLFDGRDLAQWKPSSWTVSDGVLTVGTESIETRDAFGDCQLHLEFRAPTEPPDDLMNRGNSGVMLMGKYEVQVYDSWHEHPQQIYPDGQAAAIYGQTPPLVNASLPPGQWQAYDLVFTAPVFEGDRLVSPGLVTVFHNGVLVQLQEPIHGPVAHREILPYESHPAELPLVLQGHNCPVQFRNIWLRRLALHGDKKSGVPE